MAVRGSSFRGVRRAGALLAGGMVVALLPLVSAGVAAADASNVIVSEAWPGGSGNATYGADWFELTNTGTTAVDITGWKVDDNSNSASAALPLNGVTSIPAKTSAVFIEGDSTKVAAFKTAWFGANVPAGFTVGTYSGAGIGLGTGGDAINLFTSSGTPITGVTFGAADASKTFDNAAGLTGAISTKSAVGTNGAFVSVTGGETGSPGTITNPPTPLAGVDLSSYVRVGRYELPEPTRTTPPDGTSLLAQEASGVTYNPVTDSLFIVGDGGTSVTQVSKTGALIDSMTLAPGSSPQGTEFYDPEGVTYVGGGNQFALVEERDRQVSLFTYVPGTTLTRAAVQTVDLGAFVDNTGIEGISYDPLTSGFIAVKEVSPEGIFQTGINFAAGTATNGSPSTVNSTNLFDPALTGLADFADVYALSNIPATAGQPQEGNLLVLSQEDGRIVNVNRSGVVSSSLTIVSDPGNTLSVPNQQHEGLTMDHDANLYVVSENGGGSIDHPQLWVYAKSLVPNQAPTGVSLTNPVTTLAENTNTVTRLKVADVSVADDGLGTNDLTVTGPDAASFEVDSNGLYIKAGTTLDFETKSSYTVSVQVDDPSVGASPDAVSSAYTLTLTDLDDESTTLPNLVISEVSPWSSGSAPYGADWFEITNNGDAAVDLTGFRIDDNSNDFGASVALTGVTSLPAGQSAVFYEGDASQAASFRTAWFGASVPSGFSIGSYSGGGVGLSTGGDAVNLFDSAGNRVTGVSFGISTTGRTFDNTAGVGSTTLPLPAITTLSTAGTNGAFLASDGTETGSPGTKATTLIVSEVSPWSSGDAPYGADWFEVTNTGAGPVGITGWKFDDNSNSPVGAVALNGVTSIAAGESVVFYEGDSSIAAAFKAAWFNPAPPASLQIGSYAGSGVGLSTGGDAVNLFDAAGHRITGVSFGASTTGRTFDNAAGIAGPISTLSQIGVNGGFLAADGTETGSPGRIANVTLPPCGPGTYANELGQQPNCLPAPAGTYAPGSGSTSAIPCAAGTFQPNAGQESCRPSPAGSYVANPGSTASTPCDPGTYQPATGQSTCLPAPVDHFVPASGATEATPCPPGTHQPVTGSIACVPSGPTVSVGDATIVEGDTGKPRTVQLPVTLSEPSTSTVVVSYQIRSTGSASSPGDFVAKASGKLTFKPAAATGKTVTTKQLAARVLPDLVAEGDETFEVAITGVTGGTYTVGDSIGVGTIVDDDAGSGLRVSVGDVRVYEGDTGVKATSTNGAMVRVTLSSPATTTVSVKVTVTADSASAGSDYVKNFTKIITFAPGQFQKVVTVPVKPDASSEPDETLTVTLSDATGGLAIDRAVGMLTILNDD